MASAPPTSISIPVLDASLVRAAYGDEAPRQATPNANRGDNLTLGSPYQDTEQAAPAASSPSNQRGSAFGPAATRKEVVR